MKRKYRLVLAVMTVTLALASLTMMTGETVAKEPQKKCLELPAGYSMEDFKAALKLGREFRIEQGLRQCPPGPAAQALENLGRCWNPFYCSEVVTPSVRKIMGCPLFQEGVCDEKVGKEVLEKCNKKCGQIKNSEEREECIVDFQ